jgi:hypothetical protein
MYQAALAPELAAQAAPPRTPGVDSSSGVVPGGGSITLSMDLLQETITKATDNAVKHALAAIKEAPAPAKARRGREGHATKVVMGVGNAKNGLSYVNPLKFHILRIQRKYGFYAKFPMQFYVTVLAMAKSVDKDTAAADLMEEQAEAFATHCRLVSPKF